MMGIRERWRKFWCKHKNVRTVVTMYYGPMVETKSTCIGCGETVLPRIGVMSHESIVKHLSEGRNLIEGEDVVLFDDCAGV